MSYLDQLKKASQDRQEQDKASELKAQQQLEQRKKLFQTQVKPALEQLRQFMRELTEQLNYLKPDTPVSYKITGYGEITDFKQQNYRVVVLDNAYGSTSKSYANRSESSDSDFIDTSSDFILRCVCQTPYKYNLKKHKRFEAESQKKYFTKYHIRFTYTEEPDANSHAINTVFKFEPEISVEFKFTGDFETSTINLTVTNFAELGKNVVYILQPKQINEPFLDELAKYITRQPHNLSLRQKNTSPTRRYTGKRKLATEKPGKIVQVQSGALNTPEPSRTPKQQVATAKNKTTTKKNGLFRFFRK